MPFSLMVRAAMLSVMSVAGKPSATASYAVSLAPWLYGLVSVQYTRFRRPRACSDRTTPKHTHSRKHTHRLRPELHRWSYTHALTESSAVSSSGQAACVAVCKDGDGVSRHAGQDVLGAIVTNLPVIIHISIQHVLNPTNHTAEGQSQERKTLGKNFRKTYK